MRGDRDRPRPRSPQRGENRRDPPQIKGIPAALTLGLGPVLRSPVQ